MSDSGRRKTSFFGLEFDISVRWLIAIVVMGLIQFGVFLEKFNVQQEGIMEIKAKLNDSSTRNSEAFERVLIKDAIQDSDIQELKRRMGGYEHYRNK
jgi:hypothetical protein